MTIKDNITPTFTAQQSKNPVSENMATKII